MGIETRLGSGWSKDCKIRTIATHSEGCKSPHFGSNFVPKFMGISRSFFPECLKNTTTNLV